MLATDLYLVPSLNNVVLDFNYPIILHCVLFMKHSDNFIVYRRLTWGQNGVKQLEYLEYKLQYCPVSSLCGGLCSTL
jgi:hypothetical protein